MFVRKVARSTVGLAALGTAMAASAQTAPTPTTTDTPVAAPNSDQGDTGEVVVTGIRRSIAQALDTKRTSSLILDSISAEDIGKLPDQNTAETLSRIPGVQVTRSEGQGNTFSVRGISLNKLLINGKSFIGSGRNGNPNLADVPPELLASVDVIKAPSADLVEGWLGAIVDLKTKRPLDIRKTLISGRVEGSYADKADKFDYKGSALFSTRLTDTLGALASVSYIRGHGRSDGYNSGGWVRQTGTDVTGDGVADTFYRPSRIQTYSIGFDDKRLAVNGTLQWKPNSDFNFIIDGLHSRRDTDRKRTYLQSILANTLNSGRIDAGGTLTGANFTGVTLRPLLYDADGFSRNTEAAFTGEYKHDRWQVNLNASYSKGNSEGAVSDDTSSSAGGNDNVLVARQIAGNTVAVAYDSANGSRVSPNYALNTNFNINDPAQYEVFTSFDQDYINRNKGKDADFAVRYEVGGLLRALKAGARIEQIKVFSGNATAVYPAGNAITFSPGADPTPTNSLRANEVGGLQYRGLATRIFEGESGSFPRVLPSGFVDADAFRAFLGATPPSLDTVTAKGTINQVKQTTKAAFVKAEFGGEVAGLPFSGDVGVRQVHVKRDVSGFTVPNATTAIPTTQSRTFNATLPSFNLIARPNSEVALRFSAAKVSARPDLSTTGVGVALAPVTMTGVAGNPDLKPYSATQYDLSAEWYFARASLLSVTGFYKNVSAFTLVTQTTELHPEAPNNTMTGAGAITYLVSRPQNGTDGKIKGFEVNYQHALTFLPSPLDGFGYALNYTYAKSTTPNIDAYSLKTLPIPFSSKNSYSAILYYEKGRFNARAAYTYRSSYLVVQQAASAGGSRYAAGRGQLDASAGFKLSENFRLTAEAVNLLKNVNSFYTNDRSRLYGAFQDDRRIYFGVSATF